MATRPLLIDTHCHLNNPQFATDLPAVLARAREAGVAVILVPGYDLPSSRRAVELADRYSQLYATVGVHPHDAKELDAAALAELRRLAAHPRVVGIGEIGLDYFRNLSPKSAQLAAFRAQLDLAAELALPVVIHDRDAHADILAEL
ncbi:MAG: TatD family hydrolase, partial [Chloroflexi bacterium]|nr:TatD family hydrolase [Chloroflexota bacterium]